MSYCLQTVFMAFVYSIRQIDRWTNRQMNRWTDRQSDRWTDQKKTDRHKF